MTSEDVREKIKQTNQEKYGADYYMQTNDFAEKSYNTIIKRYSKNNGNLS